jgi:hypothetical protein
VDAGRLSDDELVTAADNLLALKPALIADVARQAAKDRFSTADVGIQRYRQLYDTLVR